MNPEDKRVHARIHVSTTIEVQSAEGRIAATLCDVSKGGARFLVPSRLGAVGETVELFLPSLDRSEIAVAAQIIRILEAAEGYTVAVRFDEIDPAQRQALSDLIDVLLATTGGGKRAHARVARRMEIRFGPVAELLAILEDISMGGLSMTVADPLVLYEELDVTVPDTSGDQLLILHARVVNQRAVDTDGERLYRVGLEFAPMRSEARACIDGLMKAALDELDRVEQT